MDTACINARGIHHILIARSESDVKQTSGFRESDDVVVIVIRCAVTIRRMAGHRFGSADVELAVNGSHDGTVAEDLHCHSFAFDEGRPSGTLVGGVLQTFARGSIKCVARSGQVIHKRPSSHVIERGSRGSHLVDVALSVNHIDTCADEAVVVALLAEAIVFSRLATAVTSTDIDDTVSVLGHAADHQVLVAHLMPSDTSVVGHMHAAALRADIDPMGLVVVKDCCGLTTHVVGTHADPIQIVSIGCFGLILSGLQHQSGVNQTCVLVGTETAHEAFSRFISLSARHIVTAIVSDSELAEDQNRHHER